MALAYEARALLKALHKDEEAELFQIVKTWKRYKLKELIHIGIPKSSYYEFFMWYSKRHLAVE